MQHMLNNLNELVQIMNIYIIEIVYNWLPQQNLTINKN